MEVELPECPVCLQVYNNKTEEEEGATVVVIPRVLSCGHSVCESCLTRIPQHIPNTIRCPACTQLVYFPPPPQGPSALPKNIDLLSFITQHHQQQNPNNNNHTSSHQKQLPHRQQQHDFLPAGLLWSDENEKNLFYSNWKDWILPADLLSIKHQNFLFASLYQAEVIRPLKRSSSSCCSLRANQMVSLLHIGSSSSSCSSLNDNIYNDGSKVVFNLSYTARVMDALNRLREEERAELSLILTASSSSRQFRVCKAYGLWMHSDDGSVFLVCQHFSDHLPNNLLSGGLRNSVIGGSDVDVNGLVENREETTPKPEINERMSGFALVAMDLCEALIGLHSEGLVCGCLAMSCFTFGYFRRVFIDPNEVLVIGRTVRKCIAEIAAASCSGTRSDDLSEETDASFSSSSLRLLNENRAFVSPEILFRLLHNKGSILPDCDSLEYSIGYSSDVWSLACILVLLLVGDSFIEGLFLLLNQLPQNSNKRNCDEFLGLYRGWVERVSNVLGSLLSSEFSPLHQVLCRCLDIDPGSRPYVNDVLRCIRELIIKPGIDIQASLDSIEAENDTVHCLILGDLCDPRKEIGGESGRSGTDFGQVREGTCNRDAVEGLCLGKLKSINLQGPLDCITGFAVGGGYLLSSSFDKAVHVWSLQNFSHVQTLRGHEHRVMAIVFVDAEEPLCISGDSGGGIFVWGIGSSLKQEPLKKWSELKDWRYSGIHAMAVSGTHHLYTGSGDKSIKAWSLQDYTLTCTMNGHKSVVSSLAVSDGVLYSGSWDGTIRLWSLNNHTPLAVLGDDVPGNVASVLSLSVEHHMLVAAYENGCVKIWRNDVLSRSIQTDDGAILALDMDGKWLFMGGWNKTVRVQEMSEDDLHVDARLIGSIACDSVVTALLYWEGKLYVGFADRVVKVYYYEPP